MSGTVEAPWSGGQTLIVAEEETVVLTIPAQPEYVGLSRLAVAGLGRMAGLDLETVADLKLAVTEACTYMLQNLGPTEGQVLSVGMTASARRWVVEVVSSCVPEGGSGDSDGSLLGLTVMRALVDEVQLETRQGGQSVLRLTKQL